MDNITGAELIRACSAIGAGLDVAEPSGNIIVDIGGGTTEVAVISLGGIVISNSLRIAGDELDEDIVNYIKKEMNLAIGETTAEQIKVQIGCAMPLMTEMSMDIRGRDSVSGLPKTLTINSAEIKDAITDILIEILEAVKSVLNQTPPEISADIVERGIVMSGGTSLLPGFTDLISMETGVPVILAESPLTCVAIGCGKFIEETKNLKNYRRYS